MPSYVQHMERSGRSTLLKGQHTQDPWEFADRGDGISNFTENSGIYIMIDTGSDKDSTVHLDDNKGIVRGMRGGSRHGPFFVSSLLRQRLTILGLVQDTSATIHQTSHSTLIAFHIGVQRCSIHVCFGAQRKTRHKPSTSPAQMAAVCIWKCDENPLQAIRKISFK